LSTLDALVIPVPPAAAAITSSTRYRVQRGDTLVTVADRFDVTPEQLRRWNHLRSGKVVKGQSLYVAEPARVAARGQRRAGKGGASRRSTGAAHKTTASRKTAKHGASHATAHASSHPSSKKRKASK
jgi:membrane-bound lytic murein transglycosylase D